MFLDQFLTLSFNSRPHAEVDDRKRGLAGRCELSTHDLTQRSTGSLYGKACFLFFQLTTSRRGRHAMDIQKKREIIFQLTTSRRGRLLRRRKLRLIMLSTHDLTQRSTCVKRYKVDGEGFQLTTSRRGRPGAEAD